MISIYSSRIRLPPHSCSVLKALQFAHRNLIGRTGLRLCLREFLHILSALNPSQNSHMFSHVKSGSIPGISSPADTGDIIGFSIRTVYCKQKIRNFSPQRCFPVHRAFTHISFQKNVICSAPSGSSSINSISSCEHR